jgi:hypothetical protein
MPGLIGVSEFLEETREDYHSPTTSTFCSRMSQCRQTISALEEVSENKKFKFNWSYWMKSLGKEVILGLYPSIRLDLILHGLRKPENPWARAMIWAYWSIKTIMLFRYVWFQ